MENIAQLSDTERKELFAETAIQKNISPAIIEKDFWVQKIKDTHNFISKIAEIKDGNKGHPSNPGIKTPING